MTGDMSRRDFLSNVGITVGASSAALAGIPVVGPTPAEAAEPPKGRIPDTPVKFGHMTFMSGPGALLGEPSWKGHSLAVEEINAAGGLLGKRKIETMVADEAAGADANVKELRRMKLSAGIEWFTGVIAVHHTLALAPVAEELKVPTIFTEGCGDMLFEKVDPNPYYVFGMTNILSADGVSCAIAVARTWPEVRKIAHVHPDYAFGRWFIAHFNAAIERLLPGIQVVSEGWPKLGEKDFSAHISRVIATKPDLLVTALWGGDYVAFYRQALRMGLYDKMKVCASIAFGCVPHSLGKDHPEGILAGVHSNYQFTHPAGNLWPLNKQFVERYHARWKEYPNLEAEAAYTGMYFLKTAVEKANRLTGGWPDTDAIIKQLEGLMMAAPAGYVYIRPEDHRAHKDIVMGFSKNVPSFPFPVWDPATVMTIPIRHVTAPPNWPKPGQGHNELSATINWMKETWPKAWA